MSSYYFSLYTAGVAALIQSAFTHNNANSRSVLDNKSLLSVL